MIFIPAYVEYAFPIHSPYTRAFVNSVRTGSLEPIRQYLEDQGRSTENIEFLFKEMIRQLLRFDIHSKSILKVLKDYENAPQLIDSGARKDGDISYGRWTNQQKFILILLEYSLLMYYDTLELKMERFKYLILVCDFFGIHRNY